MGCAAGGGARRAAPPAAARAALVGRRLAREDDRNATNRVSVTDNAYCARGESSP